MFYLSKPVVSFGLWSALVAASCGVFAQSQDARSGSGAVDCTSPANSSLAACSDSTNMLETQSQTDIGTTDTGNASYPGLNEGGTQTGSPAANSNDAGTPGLNDMGTQADSNGASRSNATSRSDRTLRSLPSDAGRSTGKGLRRRPAATASPLQGGPPTQFQRMVQGAVGTFLPIFGADLFTNPVTFAPIERIPVTADYLIGPGDEVMVRVWGHVNLNVRATVDRAGDIYIPQVGDVHIAGLQFSQLNGYLRNQFSPIFRNFDLSANMGQLRSIQILVVGQARHPGSYTISSLSTLVNALFITGGPSTHGSMRRIEVVRGDKVVTIFDLYDLLLKGHKSKDLRLLSGDVIYIPSVGPVVAVAGSVNVPAIYELKGEETVGAAIQLAGGESTMAARQGAELERTSAADTRQTMDVSLDTAGLETRLRDGDILRIPSIVLRFDRTVTLRGNVANPGRYAWHSGMHITDLIPDKQSLETRDYWQHRIALGLPAPEYTPLTAAGNRRSINNEVIRTAPAIDWRYAVVERVNPENLTTSLVSFDLGKAITSKNSSQDIALQPEDVVTIFSTSNIQVPQSQLTKYVRLQGEFAHAGVYSVRPGETLRQLVVRAGGLSPQAYLYGSKFLRLSTQHQQQIRLNQYVSQLEQDVQESSSNAASTTVNAQGAAALSASAKSQQQMISTLRQMHPSGRIVLKLAPYSAGIDALPAMPLEDGDRFIVPPVPSTVNVLGAVYSQDSYLYYRGERVGDYLQEAGGATRNADRRYEFVIRANGSILSKQYAGGTVFGGGLNDKYIYPGDTVVVPNAINKTTVLRGLTDWSAVFSQFGLGIAALTLFGL
jgi:polysaccharide export outer membrane protein